MACCYTPNATRAIAVCGMVTRQFCRDMHAVILDGFAPARVVYVHGFEW